MESKPNDFPLNPKFGAFSGLSAQNDKIKDDIAASNDPTKNEKDFCQLPLISVDQLSNNSGRDLVGRIKNEQKEELKNKDQIAQVTNIEIRKAPEVQQEENKIEQVGSRFLFEGMI